MVDPVQEWFPALSNRHSSTTLQGLEWTLFNRFMPRLGELYDLQECSGAVCVEKWADRTALLFTHVLIDKPRVGEGLLSSFRDDPEYVMIYENPTFVIFAARH